MADPLSIAAGSVSFISLVIQILDKAKQIYDFWRDLDGMPNRFQPLLTDMAVVKTVLREIVDTAQQESYPEAECLIQRCNSQIELLLGEVRDFRRQPPRRRASRVRLTFKLVYKEQKIEEMRHSVLEVLRYLSLALQVIHSRGVSKIAKFAPEIVAIREANRSIIEISSSSLDSISKIAADCLTMKKLLGPDEGFSEMALSSLEGCVKKAVASAVAEIQPKESEMASDLTRDTEEENRHAEKLPRWMGEKRR
ncbi:hypothetical protein B0T18DRAFT_172971 [Schizothecium vesticola]|uniref:NACHT-NTPase and P-loop NTPases N-terminal domain-containing protein n=1 Tax=Schizothecium vesticola TaxID=314040 RepID=A0AA40K1W8_9PEZI|nr:hypothetical protein B0T18DRAFT_172971 [Schizothecium vesticola]